MAQHVLDGSSTPIALDDHFTLVAPGVTGILRTESPGTAGRRARAFGDASFDAQLESAGLTRRQVVDVDATDVRRTRALGEPPAAITLAVPADEGVVVLLEDESGALSWHVPDAPVADGATARALGADAAPHTRTITIPIEPPAATPRARAFGGIGQKVLKIFTFPLVQVAGAVGAHFVRQWESEHRPYSVRTFDETDYTTDGSRHPALAAGDWTRLAGGRALLFVHGTFSTSGAFSALDAPTMAALSAEYGGRLFAFEHPTLADSPRQNAEWLLGQLPDGVTLEVDVISHSRGGLVARELANLGATRGLTVRRLVMVGVPNGGTALADTAHLVAMIDRYTTLARLFPSRVTLLVLDALVTALKAAAEALLERQDGLKAMNPAESYLPQLNGGTTAAELYAIASNFEPRPGTALWALTRVADAGADAIFQRAGNDLVVPTEGTYAIDAPAFPVPPERRFVFAPETSVMHTAFFEQAETRAQLRQWLTAGQTRDLATVRAHGLGADDLRALRPHVVNLSNGTFARTGDFATSQREVDAIFDEHIPAWRATLPAGAPLRVVVYAHGGLINEKEGLQIALKHVDWWRSNGVYPLYFAWETGLFDALGSVLASAGRTARAAGTRGLSDFSDFVVEKLCRTLRGELIWGAMKTNAERCSAAGGGARHVAKRLAELAKAHAGAIELHAVGHSAGSIFHSHFLPVARQAGVARFDSLHLLAPAIRVDEFRKRLLPLVGDGIDALTMYTMRDTFEQRDSCLNVYRKSLLYLVYKALEPREQEPILGLEISAMNDPAVRALFSGEGPAGERAEIVYAVSDAAMGRDASRAASHGGFDDDGATMNSILRRVLRSDGARIKPYVGDARRGREWPIAAEMAAALLAPVAAAAPSVRPAAASNGTRPSMAPAATAPIGDGSGRRLALCVGIDAYPAPDTLAGCVNDTRAWGRLLTDTLHFDRVEYLLNAEATRAAIVQRLGRLIREARVGDVLVFQYAGHGTTVPDAGGDENDGNDEAIVPHDFAEGELMTDDHLREILANVPDGVSLTCFMDCCHSGTITRMLGRSADRVTAGGLTRKARFLRLARDSAPVQKYLAKRSDDRASGRARIVADRTVLRWVNFSACDATEVAFEQNGSGDFTRLATALLKGGVDSVTNLVFQRRVLQEFGERRQQTPQLDCPADAEGVGLLQYVPMADVQATEDAGAGRRGMGDRRASEQAPIGYDRRAGSGRRDDDAMRVAESLRDAAEWIETTST